MSPGHEYSGPHVDKANRASYDYAALLYVNDHCDDEDEDEDDEEKEEEEQTEGDGGISARRSASATPRRRCAHTDRMYPTFGGGRFAWLDESSDLAVTPMGGRLLMFTGGLENPHHAQKVTHGTRYVMGWWFTCHHELEYRDDEDDEGGGGEEAGAESSAMGGGLRDDAAAPSLVVDEAAASAAERRLYERLKAQQRRLPVSSVPGVAPPVPARRQNSRKEEELGRMAEISRMSEGELATMEAEIDAYAAAVEEYDRSR